MADKQYYELYRRSSVGTTLTDTLDQLISEQRLEPQLAMKIISNFDKAIADVLGDKVKTRLTFKGHLDTYRFCDDVWTFIIKDINFKLDNSNNLTADKVRIVSCSSKKPGEYSSISSSKYQLEYPQHSHPHIPESTEQPLRPRTLLGRTLDGSQGTDYPPRTPETSKFVSRDRKDSLLSPSEENMTSLLSIESFRSPDPRSSPMTNYQPSPPVKMEHRVMLLARGRVDLYGAREFAERNEWGSP